MTYGVFMFTLMMFLGLSFIDMILDDKYDINDRFVKWVIKKVEK